MHALILQQHTKSFSIVPLKEVIEYTKFNYCLFKYKNKIYRGKLVAQRSKYLNFKHILLCIFFCCYLYYDSWWVVDLLNLSSKFSTVFEHFKCSNSCISEILKPIKYLWYGDRILYQAYTCTNACRCLALRKSYWLVTYIKR